MVVIRNITIPEMWALYEEDVLQDIVNIGARTYAKNFKGQAGTPDGYEIVYAMG